MRNTVTFFDTREDLRELTVLPGDNYDKALRDAGFNLDDLDWGFVSDTPYCFGYDHTEYNGRHYYLLHHA